MKEIDELVLTMQTLRDPVKGCPWDRQQTLDSILPYTLEEVYEVADAIERDDMGGLRDELGDLLFHICFYSQIASEQDLFDLRQVAENVTVKLQNRHPHVFSDEQVSSVGHQSQRWENIKHMERRQRNGSASLLDEINHAQPAMSRAYTLQKRAATVGFDWDSLEPVFDKLEEEISELRQAMESEGDRDRITEELGDIIFACVNLARHADVNPESALRATNRKFEQRFRYIEQKLTARDKELSDASIDEMEALWQEAKKLERSG